MKDAIYAAIVLLLVGISGERERDLRRELAEERAFADSLAAEFEIQMETLHEADR